ncbi:MAG TPA: hypothetical protein VEP90_17700 [Methylomirabilota bacterium]|nr:hypothetical protein [Methylomirabilota bacterium]
MSKLTVYGLPGVYNAIPLSLNDGDGVALGVSQEGYTIVVNPDGSTVGGTTLSTLFAPVSAASSGDNVVVSATGGKKIRVITGAIVASGNVNVTFTDDPAGTALTGSMSFYSNSGVQIPYAPSGNFQTSIGKALVLNLSSAIPVGGWITYLLL